MSPEHLKTQMILSEALRERGVEVELEAPMLSLAGDRRIDVLAFPKDKPTARVAIEVQASDITIELIEARTNSYQAENVAPLWLRLYDFGRWEAPRSLTQRNTIWIDKHYLCSWERWAYEQLGQSLWFVDSKTFLFWRGTFVQAHSYVPESSWFEPGGIEQSGGNYWKDITQWVELELEGPFLAKDLRLKRNKIRGKDGKTRISACFLAPGEDAPPLSPMVRAEMKINPRLQAYVNRELYVKVGAEWTKANLKEASEGWRSFNL